MELIDIKYLNLQYWNKVLQKSANEFQIFFEDIMGQAYKDFQKIRPYGNKGDGGNDGYIPSKGIYYQVYAPKNPKEKELEASKKLKADFSKLKKSWDQISEIKEYNFVFNDKNTGVSIEIEKALSELRKQEPNIKFNLFTPKSLEVIFMSLKVENYTHLGFDYDVTKSVSLVNESLDSLDSLLDWNNVESVAFSLEVLQPNLQSINDENINIKFELIRGRLQKKLERIPDARAIYEGLCQRYPDDSSAFLYLAELELLSGQTENCEELMAKADDILDDNWLKEFMKLELQFHKNENIPTEGITVNSFPINQRVRASYCRIYALIFERAGNRKKADSLLAEAVSINQRRFDNYDIKLSIMESRIGADNIDKERVHIEACAFIAAIKSVRSKESEWGALSFRNNALLNIKMINAYERLEDYTSMEELFKPTFDLLIKCYFDSQVDQMFVRLLSVASLPEDDMRVLNQYLIGSEKTISDKLARSILYQLEYKGQLISEGKTFFCDLRRKEIIEFIDDIEYGNLDKAAEFILYDYNFALLMSSNPKTIHALREKIIISLPEIENLSKEKLYILLYLDEQNYDRAFELLKSVDIQKSNYYECMRFLEVATFKHAWDFEIEIINRLIQSEKNEISIYRLKTQCMNAFNNLGMYPQGIKIGEELLADEQLLDYLDDANKERLLEATISMRMKRGEYSEAKTTLDKNRKLINTFEFKTRLQADVYVKNNDADQAIEAIVDGIKDIKIPTAEQYGSLFFAFTQIGNLTDFSTTSHDIVNAGDFIKFKGQDRWFFIGDGNELDASKISVSDDRYLAIIGKSLGDVIVFSNKYRSSVQYEIESILPIEKYILWQSINFAHSLTLENRWDQLEIIDVPELEGTIDTKYLQARLEDEHNARGEFFNLYCDNGNVPLAFLAINEGGLDNAISRITNEKRGFIKFCHGSKSEYNIQSEVAKRIIAGEKFYIDGTSALLLAEMGMLLKVKEYLTGMCIPQSVISMLLKIKEKFHHLPGQKGHLGIANGKLRMTEINPEKAEQINSNIQQCIEFFEKNPQNISVISSANKFDCFVEQEVFSELCDACIFAQKFQTLILTEDCLYLQANSSQTNKNIPEYTSVYILIKELLAQEKIPFEEYLEFFCYLASYRLSFLSVNADDIETAIFGAGEVRQFSPEKFKLFHPQLTLSKEYGVTFENAFFIVARILFKSLVDENISVTDVVRLFSELVDGFPSGKEKKALSDMLIELCDSAITMNNTTFNHNEICHKLLALKSVSI